MKVATAPVLGTRYTVHDGVQLQGAPTARCSVVSARRRRWHVLPASAVTTCRRCLKIREARPYVTGRTLAEESTPRPGWKAWYAAARHEMAFRYGRRLVAADRYRLEHTMGSTPEQAAAAINRQLLQEGGAHA